MALPWFNLARLKPYIFVSLAIFSIFFVGSCTTSPATGKKVISFNSLADEKRIGEREHPKIVKQFGGEYKNYNLNKYVSDLGNNLAKVSELPNLGWKFTVLNSPEINAFAIPGGFIYVTRGLVTLASNEAELAGVIAHEIGHVTALHSSTRQATGKVAGLGALAAGIIFGQAGSEIGNYIGRASIQQYSQSQEFEADFLGIRYLSRAGYTTAAMGSFLTKLREFSKIENKKLGRPESTVDQHSIFASHPRTIERIKEALKATVDFKSGTKLGRINHMAMIHGVVYGDSLEQGVVRGRKFLHPILKFRFTVPKGFRLTNNPDSVVATNLDGALIQFDMDSKPYTGPMENYLKYSWVKKLTLANIQNIQVNDMLGVTATSNTRRSDGLVDLRFVAIRKSRSQIFRMIFVTPQSETRKLTPKLLRTIYSLKRLTATEAKAIRPLTISIKPVGSSNSKITFVKQMAVAKFKEETFRILNDLSPHQNLRRGQLVKIVTN